MTPKNDSNHCFISNEHSLLNIITILKDEVIKLIKKAGKLEHRVKALEEKCK